MRHFSSLIVLASAVFGFPASISAGEVNTYQITQNVSLQPSIDRNNKYYAYIKLGYMTIFIPQKMIFESDKAGR
ncbi:hypothetical protein [Nostoc sp.]|uniref:hypothetical protein n=1 Tax=Nostoc sp. TaxID=1180 RepID=UPI002FF67415